MKVITLKQPVSVSEAFKSTKLLQVGVEYVVPDTFPSQVETELGPGVVEARDYAPPNFYRGEKLDGKSLFCFRTGGIGDLLFIGTSLRQLKKNFPSAQLVLGCDPTFGDILDGKADGFDLAYMPLERRFLDRYDYILFFQGIIENNPHAEEINAYDLIRQSFCMDKIDDLLPNVRVEEGVKKIAHEFVEKTSAGARYKIGIQVCASVTKRSAPPQLYINFIRGLPHEYMVYLVGSKTQYDVIDLIINHLPASRNQHAINASRELSSLSQAVALVDELDLVIGPDSSMLHVAAAQRIPLIGLYGPFPSDLRLRYYKNAVGIDSMTLCEFARGKHKSCFEHGDGICALAAKTGETYSPCMAFFMPKHLYQAMRRLGFPAPVETCGSSLVNRSGVSHEGA